MPDTSPSPPTELTDEQLLDEAVALLDGHLEPEDGRRLYELTVEARRRGIDDRLDNHATSAATAAVAGRN